MKIERYLTQHDAALLSKLAEHMLRVRDVKINAGEALIELISSSILLPDNAVRKDCVSLYSQVTYCEVDSEQRYSVVIVAPQDANQTLARVSVLAPFALAVIGRPVGSLVEIHLPFDKVQFVKILEVSELSVEPLEDESAGKELPPQAEAVG